MEKINVVYDEKQIATSGSKISPSAMKPKYLAELLEKSDIKDLIEFVKPEAVSIEDICRCHNSDYVDEIMTLKRKNGFGTFSQSVVESLPYTNGAMYTAAKLALTSKTPSVALVSGFHHAGYNGYTKFGYFCTFNGLMITATKLVEEDGIKKVCIIDCDMHDSNGTSNILRVLDPTQEKYLLFNFGRMFTDAKQAKEYLDYFDVIKEKLIEFKPEIIIYQAGADTSIYDPFGGIFTDEENYLRDFKMFSISKELNIPIAWNLAGGYQQDSEGKCTPVLNIHMNTFRACIDVYDEK